ncbi:hypothetical protein ABTP95_21205, partial [Acinetobacter baumannii]
GEGWTKGNTLDLQKFADELHAVDPKSGMVFPVADPGEMKAAMETIANLEKAQDLVESVETFRDVDYAYIAMALVSLFLFFGFA